MKARSRTARTRVPLLGRRVPLVGTALLATAGMVATVAAGCGDGAGAAPKITTTARAGVAPVPPKQGAYFGAWVPPEGTGRPSSSPSGRRPGHRRARRPGRTPSKPGMAPIARFEQRLGKQLDIVQSYRSWKSDFPAPWRSPSPTATGTSC